MRTFAAAERAALCNLLESVGPEAPTLCAGWTAYDLTAHLVLRERRPPLAVGAVVSTLEPLTARWMRRLKEQHSYAELIGLLRAGPPRWSPYRSRRLAETANALEFFVHHEDLRRAQPGWTPRTLPFRIETALWRRLRRTGRALVRRAPVGLEVVRTDSPDSARLRNAEPSVAVRGRPSELVLFCFGRTAVVGVELDGDPPAVAQLRSARLGV